MQLSVNKESFSGRQIRVQGWVIHTKSKESVKRLSSAPRRVLARDDRQSRGREGSSILRQEPSTVGNGREELAKHREVPDAQGRAREKQLPRDTRPLSQGSRGLCRPSSRPFSFSREIDNLAVLASASPWSCGIVFGEGRRVSPSVSPKVKGKKIKKSGENKRKNNCKNDKEKI